MGHCSSYEKLDVVDTSLPNKMLAKWDPTGVTIPSNILPGGLVQMATVNNINDETIDGKNTMHTTTIIVHQLKQFRPMPLPLVDSCRHTLTIE